MLINGENLIAGAVHCSSHGKCLGKHCAGNKLNHAIDIAKGNCNIQAKTETVEQSLGISNRKGIICWNGLNKCLLY